MKINVVKKKKEKYIFMHLSEVEALKLIRSLTCQMINKNSNVDREETFTEDGGLFTAFVTKDTGVGR